jgi:hypothetical protein
VYLLQLTGEVSDTGVYFRVGRRYIVHERRFEVNPIRFVGQDSVLLEVIVQELLMRQMRFPTIAGDLFNGRLR